jgi:hypothetical protein
MCWKTVSPVEILWTQPSDDSCSLALSEMKTLLVDVYSRFTTLPDKTTTAESMQMADQLISSQPLGKKCLVKLVPLEGREEEN